MVLLFLATSIIDVHNVIVFVGYGEIKVSLIMYIIMICVYLQATMDVVAYKGTAVVGLELYVKGRECVVQCSNKRTIFSVETLFQCGLYLPDIIAL